MVRVGRRSQSTLSSGDLITILSLPNFVDNLPDLKLGNLQFVPK